MKRRLVGSFVVAAMCAALLLALVNGGYFGKRPFASLTADEIARVTLTLVPPDKTFAVEDPESLGKLAEILNRVTIYQREDSAKGKYAGQWVEFTLSMKDGHTVSVAAYNPFLVVDSVWYLTEYKPCEALNSLGNRLAKDR